MLIVTCLKVKSIKNNLFRLIIHLMIIPELFKLLKTIMETFCFALKQFASTSGGVTSMIGCNVTKVLLQLNIMANRIGGGRVEVS